MSSPGYFTPEFHATLERIRQGRDYGEQKLRPDFDPKLAKDVADDFIQGREISDYRMALERAGFVWWPPARLPLMAGGVLQPDGQWRHQGMRIAFTEKDILGSSDFSTPQEFAEWIDKVKLVRRLARQGMRVVNGRLINRRTGR